MHNSSRHHNCWIYHDFELMCLTRKNDEYNQSLNTHVASSNYVSSLKLEKDWLNCGQIAVNSPERLLSIIKTCLEHHLQLKVVLSETWIDGYSDTLMKAVVSAAARRCSCIIVHDIAVILLGLNFSLLAKNFAILHTVPNFEITLFDDVTSAIG